MANLYIHKEHGGIVEYPTPQDIENYHTIPHRPLSEVIGKTYDTSSGQWVTAQWELSRQAREADKAAKLAGVEFEGVMCSATKEDMWGLASVKDWVRGGSSTNFNFDNGNTLTLTPQNIDAFEAVWIPFRASFFQ